MKNKHHQIPLLIKGGNINHLYREFKEISGVIKEEEQDEDSFIKFAIYYNSDSGKIKGEYYLNVFAKLIYNWIRSHNEDEACCIQLKYEEDYGVETINIGDSIETITETLKNIKDSRRELIKRRTKMIREG